VKRSISLPGGGRVVLMDSISYVDASDAGAVVVSGSHGGMSSARYVLGQPLAGACFNDAGGGKDSAGVAGLRLLDKHGIPALAVAHTSARIGDAEDTWECGVLTAVNRAAAAAGLRPGMGAQEAAAVLAAGRIARSTT
jgi:hypothetical protein